MELSFQTFPSNAFFLLCIHLLICFIHPFSANSFSYLGSLTQPSQGKSSQTLWTHQQRYRTEPFELMFISKVRITNQLTMHVFALLEEEYKERSHAAHGEPATPHRKAERWIQNRFILAVRQQCSLLCHPLYAHLPQEARRLTQVSSNYCCQ